MALPVPTGLYRLNLIGELHGSLTNNLFHFQGGRNANINTHANELTTLCNDFTNNILPKILLFAGDDFKAKSLLGVSLIPRPGVLVEVRYAEASGVQSDDCLPSFCAGLLSIRTGVGGRSGHGRVYIPGVPENLSSDSRLEGTHLALLNDIGTTLNARYGPTGASNLAFFGIFSRKLGVTRSLGPPVTLTYSMNGFMKMTTWIARPEIATQRKRKLFTGQ